MLLGSKCPIHAHAAVGLQLCVFTHFTVQTGRLTFGITPLQMVPDGLQGRLAGRWRLSG
jgi:hypothetical protein